MTDRFTNKESGEIVQYRGVVLYTKDCIECIQFVSENDNLILRCMPVLEFMNKYTPHLSKVDEFVDMFENQYVNESSNGEGYVSKVKIVPQAE